MSNYILLIIACSLLSCSAYRPDPLESKDAGIDVKADNKDIGPFTIVDAASDEASKEPPYQSCISMITKQVTTGSTAAQNCLTEVYCTDSLGQTYLDHLVDSCHNNVPCRWGLACNNGTPKVFCLPLNEQGPTYSDDVCTKVIAFVELANGMPASQYVGVDKLGSDPECRDIHLITTPWVNTGTMYYKAKGYSGFGGWYCFPSYVDFLSANHKLYNVDEQIIDPAAIAVEK